MADLTPTSELILEVLAARHRLGESWWTFSIACRRSAEPLLRDGLVEDMHGIVERTFRLSLTEAGKAFILDERYAETLETKRLRLRMTMLRALNDIGEPEAAGYATVLSHALVKAGVTP